AACSRTVGRGGRLTPPSARRPAPPTFPPTLPPSAQPDAPPCLRPCLRTRRTRGPRRAGRNGRRRRPDGRRRGLLDQAPQTIETPFVVWNVALVQNSAAFRYQTWYVRAPPLAGTRPAPETLGSPGIPAPNAAEPATAVRVPMRRIVPLAQRRPSPNTTPCPSPAEASPWKNRAAAVAGRSSALSVRVSPDTTAVPNARSRAPSAL